MKKSAAFQRQLCIMHYALWIMNSEFCLSFPSSHSLNSAPFKYWRKTLQRFSTSILHSPLSILNFWKAKLSYSALSRKLKKAPAQADAFWWERVDSDHRSQRQQIYSLPPLAARERSHMELVNGVEPSTCWLQISCSAIEPHQHFVRDKARFEVRVEREVLSRLNEWYYTTQRGKCQHFFWDFGNFVYCVNFACRFTLYFVALSQKYTCVVPFGSYLRVF